MLRAEINEVFTPRQHSVNRKMYIDRPDLEKQLLRSIKGSMHGFLFGESGNGKSWLFKKVLKENHFNFITINCANVARTESTLANEILINVFDSEQLVKKEHIQGSQIGVNAGAKAMTNSQDTYDVIPNDSLIKSFKRLYDKSNNKLSVIVFDNIETLIEHEKLLKELSNMILLLDDEKFAKFKIKFLLVGVPNEVQKYFTSLKNTSSVANRIQELARVVGLNITQVKKFVLKGFCELLKIDLSEKDLDLISSHMYDVTLGVAQKIHEYSEALAYKIEENLYTFDSNLLDSADQEWLFHGLRSSYSIIECFLNSEETTNGRRNQVIYSLGKIKGHQTTTNEISQILKDEFKQSTPNGNSGIGKILSYLTKGNHPLLKKVSDTDSYIIVDPRYIMSIRLMLFKDFVSEKIKKKNFTIN